MLIYVEQIISPFSITKKMKGWNINMIYDYNDIVHVHRYNIFVFFFAYFTVLFRFRLCFSFKLTLSFHERFIAVLVMGTVNKKLQ